ncbi:hypothetical protein S4054249_22500 [Pseudoalteromonas luteoviolacea]|uniref:Penicillin amidase n=2 Tax=Pseudoalteromonas luteoviolacea TaxID=43657 RepID=A0A0F6AC45_9GAMM|nr:hypothetical protein S4054249_22500 [Pseudoalteromonas luteoviolacea]AOT15298.1 hypothetical protein S40542_21095 [Pseudoalteromonas luteoviolacea]AOT20453.1 hypothetical protein S4054_22415 [Pseudoalteromonas luteoviolacea]KKE83733.1 hypothetical protein N479_12970 [Pseudoalteromonas luteoviolacea S4054]KZN71937.1 hypothetical protein N481_17335 [Pseudoalteromonas luteoviolacea S4047-1]
MVSRTIVWMILPLFLLLFIAYQVLLQSLPDVKGDKEVKGIQAPVMINRDQHSIPHIQASNDLDAVFGLGYTHAQDRLWQMEMNRRIGSGRLSEIIGIESLRSDMFIRTLGLRRNAEKMWQQLSPENKKILEAYVAGVNQGISHLDLLPAEYYLYQFEPEPWQPVDSLVWMQLMTWQLSNNYRYEIQRALVVKALGAEKANEFLPEVPMEQLQLAAQHVNNTDFDQMLGEYHNPDYIPKKHVGSNNWVISGKHTKTGKPLLANDPHLVNSIPSIWYLARLEGKDLHTVGATFPGLPFVVIGRNQHLAWGVTNMMADTQDIYLEKINPLNRNQYLVDGDWYDMEVFREKIKVRADLLRRPEPDRELTIRRTRNGPVLSDINPQLENFAYSLRWAGDDQDGGTFDSYVKLGYAKNWTEFNQALESFVAPVHNFVYADMEGNIGYVAPGKFPIRATGNGDVPALGWDSSTQWQGWLDFTQVPRVYNPESGILVTANNNVTDEKYFGQYYPEQKYPHHLGYDFSPGYRADRITELLKSNIEQRSGSIDHSIMSEIQGDVLNPMFDKVKHRMLAIEATTEQEADALKVLADWDGMMTGDSVASSIFVSWISHFQRLLVRDDIEKADLSGASSFALSRIEFQINYPFIERVLTEQASSWCDFQKTDVVESCQTVLQVSLQHAINELDKELGSNVANWQWNELHKNQFPHFPLSEAELAPHAPQSDESFFSRLFHREANSSGGGETVNVAPISLDDETKYKQFFGATYRQVIDLGNENENYFILNTGQSGNVVSKHYDDMISKHGGMQLLPMYSTKSHQLTLHPTNK